MASERRFLFSFVISRNDSFHYTNVTADIAGDLESGINRVKAEIAERMAQDGFPIDTPVLLSALQLDSRRPPEWVELPIMVKRSMEQIVADWTDSKPIHDDSMVAIHRWIEKIKGV